MPASDEPASTISAEGNTPANNKSLVTPEPVPTAHAVLLTKPADGLPAVVDHVDALQSVVTGLESGHGPIAVDTERASGYRYLQSAYLIQLRRHGFGTALIDPIPLAGHIEPLARLLNSSEWVLHAASQDLPCLAELGLRPLALFDTELAGRLAGYERVSLGALVERLLGYRLEKGHSASDWSRRPLPTDWLIYAALDVELLLELRDALEIELDRQGKLDWAVEEFEAIRTARPPAPRVDPWRRTSGMHQIQGARQMAAVRALWETRDSLAQQLNLAPSRVLPDSAIIDAAIHWPTDREGLLRLPVFRGPNQRRRADIWLKALRKARSLRHSELPTQPLKGDSPPAINRWSDKNPAAAQRLVSVRAALREIAESHNIPVENLLPPEVVRRLCWQGINDLTTESVMDFLSANGARRWQLNLTAAKLSQALRSINN